MSQITTVRQAAVEIEKIISKYAGNEVEDMRKLGGDKLADELILTVACLFLARTTAMIHMWSGEPVESIKKRISDAYEFDLRAMMRKITKKIGEPM